MTIDDPVALEMALDPLDRAYPHVGKRIRGLWGSDECREYMVGLIVERERPQRDGFPFEIIELLHGILVAHDDAFPEFKPRPSPWDYA